MANPIAGLSTFRAAAIKWVTLSALLVTNLVRLKQDPPASAAELTQEMAKASEQASDLGNDIQALSHRLHSSKLEYLCLAGASASLCRELSDRHIMQIDFHCEYVPKDLPQETSLCLFRVLQESVQNAIKHSGSSHFEVSLSGGLDEIQLTVSDSGIGFDPEEAMKGRGIGLASMNERLKLVNGDLSIDSQVQRGTTIHVHVPLSPGMKSVGTPG